MNDPQQLDGAIPEMPWNLPSSDRRIAEEEHIGTVGRAWREHRERYGTNPTAVAMDPRFYDALNEAIGEPTPFGRMELTVLLGMKITIGDDISPDTVWTAHEEGGEADQPPAPPDRRSRRTLPHRRRRRTDTRTFESAPVNGGAGYSFLTAVKHRSDSRQFWRCLTPRHEPGHEAAPWE